MPFPDKVPALETSRLQLREVVPDDAPALFRLRGDREVTRLNIGTPYTGLKQAEDLVGHIYRSFLARREIWWAVIRKPDPSLIGLCILHKLPPQPTEANLGYEMVPSCWGQGVMTEAAQAVLEWGFETLGLQTVQADADTRNTRSERLLERIGFRSAGTVPGGRWAEGERHDLQLFTLTVLDWRSGKKAGQKDDLPRE